MYSLKTKNDVNEGRFEIFENKYKSKSEEENVMKKQLIGYDASNLPPCKRELLQHTKRTVYIADTWCNAHMRVPTDKIPEDFGWVRIDDRFEYFWFDGDQSPTFQELSGEAEGI